MAEVVIEYAQRAGDGRGVLHVRGLPGERDRPSPLRPVVQAAIDAAAGRGLPAREAARVVAEGVQRGLLRAGFVGIRVTTREALEEFVRRARGPLPAPLLAAFDACRQHQAQGLVGDRIRLTRGDLRTYDPRTGCSVCAKRAKEAQTT